MARHSRINRGEQGFILITAIWLLLLAGAIVALLMLRSLAAASDVADRQREIEADLALDAAFETIFADRLVNGVSSEWWLVPASGSLTIGRVQVSVEMTSESGRIDINEASPDLIDTALRTLHVDAAARGRVIDRITSLRSQNHTVQSFAELRQIEAETIGRPACIDHYFTFSSGLATPRPDQIADRLASALGITNSAERSTPPEAGAGLRFIGRTGDGRILTAVARMSSGHRPIAITVWEKQKRTFC